MDDRESDRGSDRTSDRTERAQAEPDGLERRSDGDAEEHEGDGDAENEDAWGRIPISDPTSRRQRAEDDDPAAPGDPSASEPEPNSQPVRSGDPSLEGAVFVLLGAIAMVLVMVRLGSIFAI
ncbi:DUF7312 domain-containing protein [Natronosalvus rutilus]|uniref:DUF7312 domain-containing protein n=1 Tax=Natronosalvus rutilus TaxID=2953753 RepID=A0A9E7STC3_9EURY|nr:hypothetical protein [Natronosalvus rutilus]UTF53529.1 hypothetical protein NGM29_17450 [Natronosalvus rutilus]